MGLLHTNQASCAPMAVIRGYLEGMTVTDGRRYASTRGMDIACLAGAGVCRWRLLLQRSKTALMAHCMADVSCPVALDMAKASTSRVACLWSSLCRQALSRVLALVHVATLGSSRRMSQVCSRSDLRRPCSRRAHAWYTTCPRPGPCTLGQS